MTGDQFFSIVDQVWPRQSEPHLVLAGSDGESRESIQLIPRSLVGPHRTVVRRWKTIARQALENNNDWGGALNGEEFVPLQSTSGLLLTEPDRFPMHEQNVLLYAVPDSIAEVCNQDNFDLQYQAHKHLFMSGLDHFWFCLAHVSTPRWVIDGRTYQKEQAQIVAAAVPKLLRWWPDFLRLATRFDDTWPAWFHSIGTISHGLKIDSEELHRMLRGAGTDGQRVAAHRFATLALTSLATVPSPTG